MKLHRPPHTRRSAFTILEVLVAMAILLVGMTSVLGLLSFGAAMTRNAALKSAGSSAIDALTADLEERFFPLSRDAQSGDWIVGEPVPIVDRPLPNHAGLTYSAKGTPDPDDHAPGGAVRWKVEVELRWLTGGRSRTRSFTTLLLRQVPFGERLRRELIEGEPAPLSQQATRQP